MTSSDRNVQRGNQGNDKPDVKGGGAANDKSESGGNFEKASVEQPWKIGYGRPPIATRFVKGQSGNPGGRPKKQPMDKKTIGPTTRDTVLEVADRLIANSQGPDLTAFQAVLLKQLDTALKGNPIAQKYTVDLFMRCKAAHEVERSAQDKHWSEYKSVLSQRLAAGEPIPDEFIHPDDIIFENGHFVGIRGGDPIEAAQNRKKTLKTIDLYLLQAELDRRTYRSQTKIDLDAVEFTSFVFVLWLNEALPERLRLDDNTLTWRVSRTARIKTRDLIRRLKNGYAELELPDATKYPPITAKVFRRCVDEAGRRLGFD